MMILRKLTFTLMLAIGCTTCALAQNSIDKLVTSYSTLGNSKFTSAVERDPYTKKVKMVVKELEKFGDVQPFVKAFREEKRLGNFYEQRDKEKATMTLTIKHPTANRVYRLRYDLPPNELNPDFFKGKNNPIFRSTNYKVTIIVNYKY